MAESRMVIPLTGSLTDPEGLAQLHRRVWLMLARFAQRYLGSAEGTELWSRYVDRPDRDRGSASPTALDYPLPSSGAADRTDARAVHHWLELAASLLDAELRAAAELYGARIASAAAPAGVTDALARAAAQPLVELRGKLWQLERGADRLVCNSVVLARSELAPQEREVLDSGGGNEGCRCDMCSMILPRPEIEASMCHHISHATSIEAGTSAAFYLGNMARPSERACAVLLAVPPALSGPAARAMRRLAPRCPSWLPRLWHEASGSGSSLTARSVALAGLSGLVEAGAQQAPPVLALLHEALGLEPPLCEVAALEIGHHADRADLEEARHALLGFLARRPGPSARHHAALSLVRLERRSSAASPMRVVESLRDLALDPDPIVQALGLVAVGGLPPLRSSEGETSASTASTPADLSVERAPALSADLGPHAARAAKGRWAEPLSAQLRRWLDEDGWPVRENQGGHLATRATGHHGDFTVIAYAREKFQQLVVYALTPERVAPARRSEVAELIVRLNYGLLFGNFEMDFSDGEVRYKTMLDAEGLDPVPAVQIKNLFMANVHTIDRHAPWIAAVASGRLSAEQAAAAFGRGDPPPLPGPSRDAPPSPEAARFLDRLERLIRRPIIDERAVAEAFSVELRDNESVLFGPDNHRFLVGRPADGVLECVELTVDLEAPGGARMNLEIREPYRFGREVLDAQWLAPGVAPPPAQKVNAPPSPGSPPAAFDRWAREDHIEYEHPLARIQVKRDAEQVARISFHRRPL